MAKNGKRRLALLCMLAVLLTSMINTTVYAQSDNYSIDSSGNLIPIPQTYEVKMSIKNFDEYGFLSHPEDIFIDKEGYIYIADTGNNRLLKINQSGQVVLEIKSACDKNLKNPKGVYVGDDGSIWIADTGNLRIVVVEPDGSDRKEYIKPESSLLESNFTFDVEKIYVNKMGYIFALKGANILRIDASNNFQGYMGASEVGFNLSRFLIRKFGTKEQIERTVKLAPTSYENFMIANDGSIYGVLASGTTGQIRRLNSIGTNTFVSQPFGYNILKDGDIAPTTATFSDITVFDSGITTVIDQWTGMIYQYDQDGNLLTSFGGIGNTKDLFQVPVGIASDRENNLYVLDYSVGVIKVFHPTSFINTVHQAIIYNNGGRYADEQVCWDKVLKLDSSYSLAHKGMGKIAYKNGDYKQSMAEYKLADDKEGYSKSFARYLHSFLREYFGWIMLGAIGLIYAVGKSFAVVKRRSDKWCYQIEMKGEIE